MMSEESDKVNNFFVCLVSCLKETEGFSINIYHQVFSGLEYCYSLDKTRLSKPTIISIISRLISKEWIGRGLHIEFRTQSIYNVRQKFGLSDNDLLQLMVENSGEKDSKVLKEIFETLFHTRLERPKEGAVEGDQKEFRERLVSRETKLLFIIKEMLKPENYNFEFFKSIIDFKYVEQCRYKDSKHHEERFDKQTSRTVSHLILDNIKTFDQVELSNVIDLIKKTSNPDLYELLLTCEKQLKSQKELDNIHNATTALLDAIKSASTLSHLPF